ncbi:hypothetical protein E3N88_25865 [Mikania micrantha]|uniref:Uncharacterized protein n=1 Tax=Mikania micrantha TaxID=192012 RepID=A0A5N6N7D6_9ASTR|nr:hypothetical protein E3N88_25865 [Mikania micrantha]
MAEPTHWFVASGGFAADGWVRGTGWGQSIRSDEGMDTTRVRYFEFHGVCLFTKIEMESVPVLVSVFWSVAAAPTLYARPLGACPLGSTLLGQSFA